MKDTWILLITLLCMVLVLLGGQALRGDYARETSSVSSVSTDLQDAVIERDGLALVNVNLADAEALMTADGVGEVLSERIIAYREEHGPFQSMEDLLNVSGIGPATLERLRGRLFCP